MVVASERVEGKFGRPHPRAEPLYRELPDSLLTHTDLTPLAALWTGRG